MLFEQRNTTAKYTPWLQYLMKLSTLKKQATYQPADLQFTYVVSFIIKKMYQFI